MKRTSRRRWAALATGVVVLLAVVLSISVMSLGASGPGRPGAGGSGAPSASPSATVSGSPTAVPPVSVPAAGTAPVAGTTAPGQPPSSAPVSAQLAAAQQRLATMTPEQKVGQVLMVSSPVTGADAAALTALTSYHVGNVFLKGRGYDGTAAVAGVVASLKAQVSAQSTAGVSQFIATDQEGGMVQIMNGPGFSAMPAAIDQGALDPVQLRADARLWGSQLAGAGINVNFAPVLDTVPSAGFAPANAPIGHFGRQYGFTPEAVSAHGTAFANGMADGGVAAVAKHFPGLGRVTANTDTSSGVVDGTTVRNDPFIAPFRDAVRSGVRWMMISNADYPAIDPARMAPFSSVIMDGMVRGDLGFSGIIVSDDICDAVQLSPVAPRDRGAGFIAAGGTMALCTNQTILPQLYHGMLDRQAADPAFAAMVDAAALKVLEVKAESGLLPR
ncbi:glycoside hydrolase family 3 N-terminal domain-containing protein [Arthrobacter sp. A5]|uniref:glycoside hydrolase family 3 N-terminal domain-containing protein n=1 Tax=Arthrobacter sp. A5 TaxID=576926 RepID=UPI003DAA3060